ncbi:accessory protein [Ruloma virus]|uniref:Accessory protein n=1 Tax=Ruloma virus TaxID=2811341 RepID=A0AAE7Q0I2_9MONO|nr:accessory protein [Ruloma virus]QRN45786.1 accessory protein [Ruloma virus]
MMGSRLWRRLKGRVMKRQNQETPSQANLQAPERNPDQKPKARIKRQRLSQTYPQPGEKEIEKLQIQVLGRRLCIALDMLSIPVNQVNQENQEEVTVFGMMRMMAELVAETGDIEVVRIDRLLQVEGLSQAERGNMITAVPLLISALQILRRYYS